MKTTLITLAGLTLLSLAETTEQSKKNCNCTQSENSRAAELAGTKALDFTVTGMSCGGCESSLTEKLKKIKAITSIDKVSHTEKLVSVTVTAGTCQTVVSNAITAAGYVVQAESKENK